MQYLRDRDIDGGGGGAGHFSEKILSNIRIKFMSHKGAETWGGHFQFLIGIFISKNYF